jgi:hypothetical protein
MALAPFWLDDCFDSDPDAFEKRLLDHRKFRAAIKSAQAAALQAAEAESEDSGGPMVIGRPSPRQAARSAFIDSLGLSIPEVS